MRINGILSKIIFLELLVLLVFILLAANTMAAPQDLSFNTPVFYSVGSTPFNVKTKDFNGDKKLDLAVINQGNNSISILLGKGDGTFNTQGTYVVGTRPMSMVVGDFNGDGKADLAISNLNSNNISVLIGKGDGTFSPQVTYAVNIQPSGITTGDFNGDGIPDLATSNNGSNNVSILLGKGDGTFNPQLTSPLGNQPIYIITGDFNQDGNFDLAAGNYNTSNSNISVLLGKGDGTFNAPVYYPVGSNPRVTSVDFNDDGILDLATANVLNNNVSVLLGNGDGTFAPQVTYPVGSQPIDITSGDFDSDGVPDLVIPNKGSGYISALSGKGDGTLYPQVIYSAGSQPFSAAVGDFNGDAKDDIAVADFSNNRVAVLINNNTVQVNQPPVLTSIGNQTMEQGQLLQLVIRASDPNNDTLTFGAANLPTGATFDPTTQIFTWIPGYTQVGSYTIRFEVSDGSLTASQNVIITVNKVNLPPVINFISEQTVNENEFLQYILSATDPNEDPLTYSTFNLPTGASFDPTTQTFSWTPNYSQAGIYTVNFQVSDGSLTTSRDVFVTVNQVNLPPELATVSNQTVAEGQSLQFTIIATDPDGDALTYSASGIPEGANFDPATQTFSWTPSYSQAGTYTVNFQVSDGSLTVSRDVFIIINQVNIAPKLVAIDDKIIDEGKLLQFTVSAADPDGDALTYSASGIPEGANFDPATQTFRWTPSYSQAGTYTVNFQVSDGSLTVSRDVFITVNQVNLTPELAAIGNQIVEEGKLLQFTISATDPDGDALTYSASGIPQGASFDSATQTFSWTPKQNQTGVYEVIFEVSDGVLKSSEVVTITVNENIDREMRIKALIQRLIQQLGESKLPSHHKSKLILQLKELANSKFTKSDINKLNALLHGIKAQYGKKVPREIEETIKNLLKELSKFHDHKDHKPGKNDHHDKDYEQDKNYHHEKR